MNKEIKIIILESPNHHGHSHEVEYNYTNYLEYECSVSISCNEDGVTKAVEQALKDIKK